jgi:hypothetical protein
MAACFDRPVDVVEDTDGTISISDDYDGASGTALGLDGAACQRLSNVCPGQTKLLCNT